MKPLVYIPEPINYLGLDLLSTKCSILTPWQTGKSPDHSPLENADAVIVRLFQIDRGDIARAKQLKVIAKHGVGLDNIDCQAATDAAIPVVYTPAANANAVAEHTLAMLLALCRQIVPASEAIRGGRFNERGRFQGIELAGKTLGLVGLGRVGSRVAQAAAAGLQLTVIAFDPFIEKDSYNGPAELVDSLESLIRGSDFISLHVTLTPETRRLINARTLEWAKEGCRLINTSRGAVIDEEALVAALHNGRLDGAALDVFEEEPLPVDHPLLSTPNTLLTPHISSSTQESLERMSLQAAQGILDVLEGRRAEFIVNPEVDPERYH